MDKKGMELPLTPPPPSGNFHTFFSFLARRCEPYKSLWNKRDKSVFYLVWCKPVKCMQTTLLLSAADQLLNKLGGVKEL